MTERELLVFLANNFCKWNGKPVDLQGSEVSYTPLNDVWLAINETSKSFSPLFILYLFSLLQQVNDGSVSSASEYGRFYNDPEKKLDELKREHDLNGFKAISRPEKGGRATKELFKKNEDSAYEDWKSWPNISERGGQALYIDEMTKRYKVTNRTVNNWLKKWKAEKA